MGLCGRVKWSCNRSPTPPALLVYLRLIGQVAGQISDDKYSDKEEISRTALQEYACVSEDESREVETTRL